MATRHPTDPSDPTRTAWIDTLRPSAERTIANLWRADHRFAVLSTAPRRPNKRGRIVPGARFETSETRLRKFHDLRAGLCAGLASAALSADTAREHIARSEFADSVRVATARDEAVQHLAEFFAAGDNAWGDGDGGLGVLWIDSWRE